MRLRVWALAGLLAVSSLACQERSRDVDSVEAPPAPSLASAAPARRVDAGTAATAQAKAPVSRRWEKSASPAIILSFRDKYGSVGRFDARFEVRRPDGKVATTTVRGEGDTFVERAYPRDFGASEPPLVARGEYSWTVWANSRLVTRSRFVIRGRGELIMGDTTWFDSHVDSRGEMRPTWQLGLSAAVALRLTDDSGARVPFDATFRVVPVRQDRPPQVKTVTADGDGTVELLYPIDFNAPDLASSSDFAWTAVVGDTEAARGSFRFASESDGHHHLDVPARE